MQSLIEDYLNPAVKEKKEKKLGDCPYSMRKKGKP